MMKVEYAALAEVAGKAAYGVRKQGFMSGEIESS
jgi:hypothetical protein